MPRGGKREGAGPKPRRLIIEIEAGAGNHVTHIEQAGTKIIVTLGNNSVIEIASNGPRITAALDKMRGARAKKD